MACQLHDVALHAARITQPILGGELTSSEVWPLFDVDFVLLGINAMRMKDRFTWGPTYGVSLWLTSLNMEAKSQLSSFKKPLKYD